MSDTCTHLKVCAFGCALGFTWALGVLIMGWLAWLTGWGAQMVNLIGSVYIGYQANWWGPIVGAIWGFVDWFISGVIIAWVYNWCTCCKKSSCAGSQSTM